LLVCYNVFMPSLKYTPEWKKYERDLHSPDPVVSQKAAEQFDLERENEMKTSGQARRWETERKAEIASMKPEWVKKRHKAEQEALDYELKRFLKGGVIMNKLRPAPGFVLVKPLKPNEKKTETGIYLADNTEAPEPNKGLVIAVGKDKTHVGGVIEERPCEEGEVVLHKFNTLEILLKGEKHNLMGFGDVLGVIEND